MELVVAIALTSSASMTWYALRSWSHRIVTPGLTYLGTVLTLFAVYRWTQVFSSDTADALSLVFITAVQFGIILVMIAGKGFHDMAEARLADFVENKVNGDDQ